MNPGAKKGQLFHSAHEWTLDPLLAARGLRHPLRGRHWERGRRTGERYWAREGPISRRRVVRKKAQNISFRSYLVSYLCPADVFSR